ncbi:MAG: hypothetical protein JXM73_13055, partial [Anaerolineae bacterium]|nr:hypothetical protein [Anaerolineae bacterium]
IECEIGNRRGQGYQLLGLARACLAAGQAGKAREYCTEARNLAVAKVEHQATLLWGITLLNQEAPGAAEAFADATARCRDLLDKAAGDVAAHYDLATALVGQAVSDPRWTRAAARTDLLAAALAEYRQASDVARAPGFVQYALRDLELIHTAGVEGLDPVFELLQSQLDQAGGP